LSQSSAIATRTRTKDYVQFLRAWVQRPRQTASMLPSSPYLGRLMAAQIDPDGGRVMELGGGTGALTREILSAGLPAKCLEVVEINTVFADSLARAFPGVSIIECPAQTVLAQAQGGIGGYQAIISGLPLLAMGRPLQQAILAEAFRLLRPGGALVQFTYSVRSPVGPAVLDALGLEAHRVGHIVRNFPPATVFRFTRRHDNGLLVPPPLLR
jgi:phosphatidylethanolamine/phosphatidyl-N-methylethanolamine N-methyltransferase